MLALRELTERADCVLPIENQALMEMSTNATKTGGTIARGKNLKAAMADKELKSIYTSTKTQQNSGKAQVKGSSDVFSDMNTIVANLLTGLTSSMRFEGSLNVDLNEITTNLVPYPKLHYIMSSISPVVVSKDHRQQPRRLDQMFSDVFQRENQLIKANPKSGTILACGLLLRGNVEVSDISRNIERIQSELSMIYWNKEGFKVGLCSVPALDHPRSVLCLSNNCVIRETFTEIRQRFTRLYKRKAHMHHYLEYIEADAFTQALESLDDIVAEYSTLNAAQPVPIERRRRKPLI